MSGIRKRGAFLPAASGYAGSRQRNGDRYRWTELPDGRFAVAVSDGMGKGERAARESSLMVNGIIKLLQAGLDPDMALKTLNMVLVQISGDEIYSTMDLAVLDASNRELFIYKIGAAPTLIRRAGRVGDAQQRCSGIDDSFWDCSAADVGSRIEILTAPAMPLGVMEYEHIPCVSTMVSPGDQVIMMTDGIVDARRDDLELQWLRKRVASIRSQNLQTLCDLVVREAVLNYGNREKDDMTVVAFTV